MKRNLVVGAILVIALAGGAAVLISFRSVDAPEQPIAFSHKVHAGDNKIPCLYCHANARRSPVAGIPSVHLCMGCHKITAADKPEVKKLHEYWNGKRPIPWTKVYDQPDFVHFSHQRHVLKGIACENCHGPVGTMERVREAVTLDMDACVTCHMERRASIDCVACHK